MKKMRLLGWASILMLVVSLACNKEPQDLVTQNAKEGGLVEVQNTLHVYQKGETSKKFTTTLLVYQGKVKTTKVNVYKQFFAANGDVSNKELLTSIDISGDRTSKVSFEADYPSLASGLTINGTAMDPQDDIALAVGDSWVLTYEAITSEGEAHVNGATTKFGVSGRLAGTYLIQKGHYIHPSTAPNLAADYSGDHKVIESVSEGVYRMTSMGPWTDINDGSNAIYFLADENDFTITVPKEFNGAVQKVWDGADEVATCQDDPDKLVNVSCDNTFEYKPDKHDIIKISYGYIRSSGTRQFDEVLVKQ